MRIALENYYFKCGNYDGFNDFDLITYYIYLHDLSDLDRLMKFVQRQMIIIPKVDEYKNDPYDYELEIYNTWRE